MHYLLILFLFVFQTVFAQKTYQKNTNKSNILVSEGWMENGKKTGYWIYYNKNNTIVKKGHYKENLQDGYWFYYSKNGEVQMEGHYVLGNKEEWWLYYENGLLIEKTKFHNGQKHGYRFRYKNKKIYCAEKYENNIQKGIWHSMKEFKKHNNLLDIK